MKVQELLTDPSKWTQKRFARDAAGVEVTPQDPAATCWCLLGAIRRCYDDINKAEYLLYRAVLTNNSHGITTWNDDPARTFAEVKALVTELDL